MDRSSVYIETTVVSYLAARPSRHPETARRQALTRAWWARRGRYRLVTSAIAVDEAARGDPVFAGVRLRYFAGIPHLPPSEEAEALATALLRGTGLPIRASPDARQVALAAVHGIHAFVSWDRAHITNSALLGRLERICRIHGYALPVLSPPTLLP